MTFHVLIPATISSTKSQIWNVFLVSRQLNSPYIYPTWTRVGDSQTRKPTHIKATCSKRRRRGRVMSRHASPEHGKYFNLQNKRNAHFRHKNNYIRKRIKTSPRLVQNRINKSDYTLWLLSYIMKKKLYNFAWDFLVLFYCGRLLWLSKREDLTECDLRRLGRFKERLWRRNVIWIKKKQNVYHSFKWSLMIVVKRSLFCFHSLKSETVKHWKI